MSARRVLEELAGVAKSAQTRRLEREFNQAKRAGRRAQEAADMVKKIDERLAKARDGNVAGIS